MIPQAMDIQSLSRPYLESLTSAELFDLADRYGIDIPKDLNRRFIIGELLEEAEAARAESETDIQLSDAPAEEPHELPFSYNETQISVIVRNPVWVYVFWDVREADMKTVRAAAASGNFCIRVMRFINEESAVPQETFDIPVSDTDRDQHIFIKPGLKVLRFDLVVCPAENIQLCSTLAVSRRVVMPAVLPDIDSAARIRSVSPILELSGLPDILTQQYEMYRQSFS